MGAPRRHPHQIGGTAVPPCFDGLHRAESPMLLLSLHPSASCRDVHAETDANRNDAGPLRSLRRMCQRPRLVDKFAGGKA